MKRARDPRINAGYMSAKEYLLLFFALSAINGLHMTIYLFFVDSGMVQTHIQLVINVLMAYVFIMSALFMVCIAFVRHRIWNRPMRTMSKAAKKIAAGDFSVRIPPSRKDGKKDFVEVMFDDFNIMAQELAAIETLKTDFISNVSHEIKTPLSVIQNYAAALQSETLPPEERAEYIKTILEATKKMAALVTNILKLNKLENQNIIPETTVFDLDEHIRRSALSFEESWEQKHITFEADLDEVQVLSNESMLEIVWNNLLSNAVKFTNPGGKILIRLKTQDNSADNPGSRLARVTVSDTGCGMDTQTQKHMFDKFYQGDTSHAQEGNGLGLALVKKTIDLLGGTISVESTPGKGSTFTVNLEILP